MKNILKNWKTTVAGIAILATTVATQQGYITVEMSAAINTILIGLGFVVAKDGNKTGV